MNDKLHLINIFNAFGVLWRSSTNGLQVDTTYMEFNRGELVAVFPCSLDGYVYRGAWWYLQ